MFWLTPLLPISTSAAAAVTSTTSVVAPGVRVAFAVTVCPTSRSTFWTCAENPVFVTLTEYAPAESRSNRKLPSPLVAVVRLSPMALLVMTTSAPTITPWLWSTTVPWIVPLAVACAYRRALKIDRDATASATARKAFRILRPPLRANQNNQTRCTGSPSAVHKTYWVSLGRFLSLVKGYWQEFPQNFSALPAKGQLHL